MLARLARAVVPRAVRRAIAERLSYALGHATRVTNDGYPQPPGAVPEPGGEPPSGVSDPRARTG